MMKTFILKNMFIMLAVLSFMQDNKFQIFAIESL